MGLENVGRKTVSFRKSWHVFTQSSIADHQKYALHPDRAGYLFIATDLETVCFEALTTTGVTTRVGEVATRMNDFDAPQPGSLPLEEEQKQIEETLAALEGMFDGGNSLAGATVLAERDDYYDLVITLRSPKLNWQFNLT